MCSSLALPPELIDAQEETVAVYDLLEHRPRHIRIISGARPRQAIGPLAPTVPVKSSYSRTSSPRGLRQFHEIR